ncbi:MAG TPA: sugar phosphate isomerase/epimerase [Roseiflexaceae bacterium]|nr:sugar phosphate isomerase/epimerase [Roseiflexaceae bacterium]HMP41197.1 sugar phosphate isomerase/epimerase [Roseiflexaceae bacterium]
MKIGYCTWGMPLVEAEVFIPFLARTGYRGIEITVIPGYTTELSRLDAAARRRILQLLKEHDLELPAIAAQTSMVDRDPALAAAHWQRLTAAVDLATEWAIDGTPPAVDTTVGATSQEWDTLKELLFERMAALVAYAEQRGVIIAAEPHVGSMLDTCDRVLELLHTINSPFLKLNFDISHFNVLGIPYAESVAALAPHTVHTHVKSERGLAPDHEFLIPGEAPFDWVGYLHAMRAAGYDGYITPEVSIMVQRRPNYDPFAAAELSFRTLADAFAAAGITAE